MVVKIDVDFDFCIIAISNAIYEDNLPQSKSKFVDAVRDYLQRYGHAHLVYHYQDCTEYREQAEKIVKKYYPIKK